MRSAVSTANTKSATPAKGNKQLDDMQSWTKQQLEYIDQLNVLQKEIQVGDYTAATKDGSSSRACMYRCRACGHS